MKESDFRRRGLSHDLATLVRNGEAGFFSGVDQLNGELESHGWSQRSGDCGTTWNLRGCDARITVWDDGSVRISSDTGTVLTSVHDCMMVAGHLVATISVEL